MKVLVTGGTGVIGRAAVTELLQRGHGVRLLSRGALEDAAAWDGDIEAFPGDVSSAAAVAGAADGCDAVVHIVGIVEESPPEVTFDAVNVQGTAHMIAEAERAGVARFVFVSSLGAARGESPYHRSKLEGEKHVTAAALPWVILRTGAVMGPGDETVSVLLRMMRTLPALPVLADAGQPFQPVWHEDVAWAIAECLQRADVLRDILNITGPDVLTVSEVIDLFEEVTDRSPVRVPLPSFIATFGTSIAAALGIDTPISASSLQMLLEGNYLRAAEPNDLTGRLGFQPESTRTRLVELADIPPEQMPEDGVGRLHRRRFVIDIHGGCDAAALMSLLRESFADIVPFESAAEPGSPTRISDGATLTLELPARGHVQVRVEQLDERSFTLATLEGHPLAGIVRFRAEDRSDDVVRFMIDVAERPASRLDQLSMALVGSAAQKRTWIRTAENAAKAAGGAAPEGVLEESWHVADDDAERLDDWVRDLVRQRQRRTDNGT